MTKLYWMNKRFKKKKKKRDRMAQLVSRFNADLTLFLHLSVSIMYNRWSHKTQQQNNEKPQCSKRSKCHNMKRMRPLYVFRLPYFTLPQVCNVQLKPDSQALCPFLKNWIEKVITHNSWVTYTFINHNIKFGCVSSPQMALITLLYWKANDRKWN